jgi:hypothetical protein
MTLSPSGSPLLGGSRVLIFIIQNVSSFCNTQSELSAYAEQVFVMVSLSGNLKSGNLEWNEEKAMLKADKLPYQD